MRMQFKLILFAINDNVGDGRLRVLKVAFEQNDTSIDQMEGLFYFSCYRFLPGGDGGGPTGKNHN